MNSFWHNLFTLFFTLFCTGMWIGGLVTLGFRAKAAEDIYLNRHPLLDDEPFFESKYADRFRLRGWGGPIWRVYRELQVDPELERLRQKLWRRAHYVILWHIGFPLAAFVMMALLNVAGYFG